MIQGFCHVGISVSNLERSVSFYRDVLGMQLLSPAKSFGGDRYQRILAVSGAKGSIAVLGAAGLRVELFEFSHPRPNPQSPDRPVCDHGITHFCIEVADIRAAYERLQAARVVFHCPPLEFPGIAIATYARDPDGNVFEIMERLPHGITDPHRPAKSAS